MKSKLKSFHCVQKKSPEGPDTKMFKLFKSINIELAAYHSGSLNMKFIKKVMDNAAFVFDLFNAILKVDKMKGLPLNYNNTIEAMSETHKATFLLWDGAFSFIWKMNLSYKDMLSFFC